MYKSWWGVAGGLYGALVLVLSTVLYGGFSIIKQPVSDLGWGGRLSSIVIFRIGLPSFVIPLVPFVLFMDKLLSSETKDHDQLRKAAFGCALTALGGLLTVMFFNDPRTDYFYLHTFAGIVMFVFACALVGLYSISFALGGIPVHRIQICWSGLCILLGVCLLVGTFPIILEHNIMGLLMSLRNASSIIQRQHMEERITAKAKWFPLVEWMLCYTLCLWFSVTGACTLSLEKKKQRPAYPIIIN